MYGPHFPYKSICYLATRPSPGLTPGMDGMTQKDGMPTSPGAQIIFADMSVTHSLAIAVFTTTQAAVATYELTQRLAICKSASSDSLAEF